MCELSDMNLLIHGHWALINNSQIRIATIDINSLNPTLRDARRFNLLNST